MKSCLVRISKRRPQSYDCGKLRAEDLLENQFRICKIELSTSFTLADFAAKSSSAGVAFLLVA